MNVRLLPSAVPGHADRRLQYLTSFLINDTLAVDAGSLGLMAPLAAQERVRHVVLTHGHIDHVASLPVFLENVFQLGPGCVTVHAGAATLDSLCRDVFNDRVWPDFIGLSAHNPPFLHLATLQPGQPVHLEGLRLTPVPLNHPVPCFGFLVEEAAGAILIATDTGPTETVWQQARATADLRAVFLEVTFPNALGNLAATTGHLTPALFAQELAKLGRPVPVYAVHLKPRYCDEIRAEVQALGLPQVTICEPGACYLF